MGRIIEGVWDCKYCDSKKIKGSIRECPVCGKARDADVKFYIDNHKNYIDEEKAKKISRNPDWICSYCDSLNNDNLNICHECGATREESQLNYFQNIERKKKVENHSEVKINTIENFEEYDAGIIYEEKENKKENNHKFNFKSLSIIFLSIIFILGVVHLCIPKTQEVIIDDFLWERSFNVEEYKTVEESDWSIPSGGRLLYQQTEIQSYIDVIDHYETKTRTYTEQVLDHYETVVTGYRDLGNGYFEEITSHQPVYRTETKTETYQEPVYRKEPVYATKYYYEIDKWVYKTKINTSGENKNPEWGEYSFSDKERKGSSFEKYIIVCTLEDEKQKEYNIDYNTWMNLEVGQKVKLKVDIFGNAELILEEQKITYRINPIGYFYC